LQQVKHKKKIFTIDLQVAFHYAHYDMIFCFHHIFGYITTILKQVKVNFTVNCPFYLLKGCYLLQNKKGEVESIDLPFYG